MGLTDSELFPIEDSFDQIRFLIDKWEVDLLASAALDLGSIGYSQKGQEDYAKALH